MLENKFEYDNDRWLQTISYFKRFLQISKIKVDKDFLRDIENDKYRIYFGKKSTFIDSKLHWHESPYGNDFYYWWKMQTLFIVFLIHKNHSIDSQCYMEEACFKYFENYHDNIHLKRHIYLTIRPLLKKNKTILEKLDKLLLKTLRYTDEQTIK
jgi:hypothetical protein